MNNLRIKMKQIIFLQTNIDFYLKKCIFADDNDLYVIYHKHL